MDRLKSGNRCREVNYFLVVSAAGLAVVSAAGFTAVSTGFAVVSTGVATAGLSVFGVSVASPPLQAVKNATTANAKITFFIGVCLNFKNYNFQFIPGLKKGNPTLYNFFFVALGYK